MPLILKYGLGSSDHIDNIDWDMLITLATKQLRKLNCQELSMATSNNTSSIPIYHHLLFGIGLFLNRVLFMRRHLSFRGRDKVRSIKYQIIKCQHHPKKWKL